MVVAAVWNLWGSMGLPWLRCGSYGTSGPCSFSIFMYSIAVKDLWGSVRNPDCYCGCGLGLMGLIYGVSGPCSFSRFMYSVAVTDLWGSMGNPDCCCGCGLGPMGRVELRRQTYGDLWRIRIVTLVAVWDLWGKSMGL